MGPTSGPQVTFIYGCPELGGNAISSQMQPSNLTLQVHSPRLHLEIVRIASASVRHPSIIAGIRGLGLAAELAKRISS